MGAELRCTRVVLRLAHLGEQETIQVQVMVLVVLVAVAGLLIAKSAPSR